MTLFSGSAYRVPNCNFDNWGFLMFKASRLGSLIESRTSTTGSKAEKSNRSRLIGKKALIARLGISRDIRIRSLLGESCYKAMSGINMTVEFFSRPRNYSESCSATRLSFFIRFEVIELCFAWKKWVKSWNHRPRETRWNLEKSSDIEGRERSGWI